MRGAGQSTVAVAWAVYASLPEDKELVVEMLPLGTPQHEVERTRADWQRALGM